MIIAINGKGRSGKDTVAGIIAEEYGFTQVAFADVLKRVLQEVYGFTDEQLWGPSENRDKPDGRYRRDGGVADGPEIVDQEVLGPVFDQYAPQEDGSNWGAYLTTRTALLKLGDALRDCYPHTIVDYGMRVAKKLLKSHIWRYDRRRGVYTVPETREWDEADRQEAERVKGVLFSDARLWRELEQVKIRGGHIIRITRPGAELGEEAAGHITESEMDSIPDSEFHYVLANDGTLEDLPTKIAEMMAHLKANPTYLQQYPV